MRCDAMPRLGVFRHRSDLRSSFRVETRTSVKVCFRDLSIVALPLNDYNRRPSPLSLLVPLIEAEYPWPAM